MSVDSSILVGNPNWSPDNLAINESVECDRTFAKGFGFSDRVFLARRIDLQSINYSQISPESWRFPLSHIEPVFEQRVDAYMRRNGRLRLTYLNSLIKHEGKEGSNYPTLDFHSRLRRRTFGYLQTKASQLSSKPYMRT